MSKININVLCKVPVESPVIQLGANIVVAHIECPLCFTGVRKLIFALVNEEKRRFIELMIQHFHCRFDPWKKAKRRLRLVKKVQGAVIVCNRMKVNINFDALNASFIVNVCQRYRSVAEAEEHDRKPTLSCRYSTILGTDHSRM